MRNNENNRPSVGVAVVVLKDKRVLIGEDRRKGKRMFGVPGGHWENKESLREAAIREVKEESGLECNTIKLVSVYDFYRADKKRSYVTIGLKAQYVSGQPQDLEDEGRMNWKWIKPEKALELNLFPPDRILIERYISGIIFE